MGTIADILNPTPPVLDIAKKAGGVAAFNAAAEAANAVQDKDSKSKESKESKKEISQEKNNPYGWMSKYLSQYNVPSAEDIEREKKREKRARLFSAIGDGISSMANLYFATKGAPNSYDPRSSMSAKTREYWDRIKRDRQAERERYLAARTRLEQLSEDWRRAERNYDYMVDKDKKAQGFRNRQLEMQGKRLDYLRAQAEARAAAKAAENERKEGDSQAKRATETSRQNYYNASAEAKRSGTSSSRGSNRKPTLNINGEVLEYNSMADYNRAVEHYAKEYGIDLQEAVESSDLIGDTEMNKRRSKRNKSVARLAAEVEKASKKKANPMSTGKKANPMR